MSAITEEVDSPYIKSDGKGSIQILEDGFITPEFLSSVKFEFRNPEDITENLNKNKDPEQDKKISVTHDGRTAYAGLTVTYPDNTESSKAVLTGCVVQYSAALERANSLYGKNFVLIGIPQIYIEKFIKDAKELSSINLAMKEKTKYLSGFHWIQCSLEKISDNLVSILYEDDQGNPQNAKVQLVEVLKDAKSHYFVNVTFTVSATATSESKLKKINLKNAQYYLTVKPTEIFLTEEAKVEAPSLPDIDRRRNEASEISEKHLASAKLAQFAMKNMKIG